MSEVTSVALPQATGQAGSLVQAGEPFSFDRLTARMREHAAEAPRQPVRPASFLDDLGYEDYRDILFRAELARWNEPDSAFHLHAFHMGWLFEEAVRLHEIVDGNARELSFSTEDFACSFVGASYFRALGRDTVYGLSARGLALNTGLADAEEFPRFTEFWLERPAPGVRQVMLFAALESASVTGAYRFVVDPGERTTMEVTARLFFRADVQQLGVAPLTSMYLFGENDPGNFDDFRPEVHDSDGLLLVNRDGEPFWRPLSNPPRLASAYLASPGPQAFGLCQRDREFAYRLEWGGETPPVDPALARIVATRTGHGGPAGVPDRPDTRKFVVDFEGGLLGRLPVEAETEADVSVVHGTIEARNFSKLDGTDRWRLVVDIAAEKGATVEPTGCPSC